jgi:hypothetical protein
MTRKRKGLMERRQMKNVFRLVGHVPWGHVYRTGRGEDIVDESSFVSAPVFVTSFLEILANFIIKSDLTCKI